MTTPATFASFEKTLSELVARFAAGEIGFLQSSYDEAKLRQDFLDPLFLALGWDLGNRQALIQKHREVEIESRTMIAGRRKRADYLFRADSRDRFVCEAKKPAESLDADYAFQAKRYAYNKEVPLALLSDFEELCIYVVAVRPYKEHPVEVGRLKKWHYTEYAAHARELWDLLSRDAVAAGSIDRLIESLPKKPTGKGRDRQLWLIRPDRTRALDAEFLNFLDEARRTLGSDLLAENDDPALREATRLNEAVQHILDRLLFLRICEDRDIDIGTNLRLEVENWRSAHPDAAPARVHQRPLGFVAEEPPTAPWHGGRGLSAPRGSLWHRLVRHFRALDRRPPGIVPFFNGNLFKPHFSEELAVGDAWLAGFLDDIGDDESPYLFNVISVEILGTIYERFLGKVIRPQGRGVTIEDKPEVRKAGGVYYTPRYIVDYIVEQTVGKLLAGQPPEKTLALRLLDPACGSGSFLLRVFERVCEHWQQWLTAHPGKRRKEWCWTDPQTKDVHLTASLKRRILTANIYGVDLDPGAVEVTQLSLYLKMLENENRNTLARERDLFAGEDEPALLPPLQDNIKCGNSLIASDFSLVPDDLVRVRAFDWPVQFDAIMRGGGFDAIAGNPPWIDIKGFDPEQTDYFFRTYATVENRMNVYAIFMHRAIELLKPSGRLGFITPNSFLTQSSYAKLRSKLIAFQIQDIVRTPDNVFEGVSAEIAISVYRKAKPTHPAQVLIYPATASIDRVGSNTAQKATRISQSEWAKDASGIFNLHLDAGTQSLLGKIVKAGVPLFELCEFCLGLTPYDKAKGHSKSQIQERVFHATSPKGKTWKPLLEGADITRYFIGFGGAEYINYGSWLGAPRDRKFFTEPRIVVRQIISGDPSRIYAGYTAEELYNTQIGFNLLSRSGKGESLKFVLAILNSRLITWFHRQRFLDPNKTAFQKILIQDAKTFPIAPLDLAKSADRARHDRLVALVDKMLALTPKLRAAKTDRERATLQNALAATDRAIDALVYELYALTPEEIALVEGRGGK
jgi:hypothetical protein